MKDGRQESCSIPAYEPNEQLLKLAEEAHANHFFLLIVDDGSGPDYADLFSQVKDYGHLISYSENGGKGHALKQAFSWLLQNRRGQYTVITLDSDGQHTVKDALRLCDKAEEAPDALYLGSRYLPKDAPLRSRYVPDLRADPESGGQFPEAKEEVKDSGSSCALSDIFKERIVFIL